MPSPDTNAYSDALDLEPWTLPVEEIPSFAIPLPHRPDWR
jgi:hypothetical protein